MRARYLWPILAAVYGALLAAAIISGALYLSDHQAHGPCWDEERRQELPPLYGDDC